MNSKTLYIVMGVSGCGKTTIGKLLSDELQLPFFDGDHFHTEKNIKKMSEGIPLTDDDRKDWLLHLNELARLHKKKGAVIACSALKKSYRKMLSHSLEQQMNFVYLKGSIQEVSERLQKRKGHFMPPDLLNSQFEALEPPKAAIVVSILPDPKEILLEIVKQLQTKKP